jgi:hypothetical protein
LSGVTCPIRGKTNQEVYEENSEVRSEGCQLDACGCVRVTSIEGFGDLSLLNLEVKKVRILLTS